MPNYLEVLKKAESLDDSGVGFTMQRTENFQAFEEALKAGASIRSHLDTLLKSGSPAGRIYAAILISELDKEAGRKALESLKGDQDMVSYRSGDLFEDRTVGELAEALLQGESILIYQK